MFIRRLASSLQSSKVDFAVCGGAAVALHGAVRGTLDVDIVLKWTKGNLVRCERAFSSMGLSARQPIAAEDLFKFRDDYIQTRNLVAWSFVNQRNPIELVDVIITEDLSHMRSVPLRIGGLTVPVLSIPDLVKMKQCSGRPQDLEDIKMLKAL